MAQKLDLSKRYSQEQIDNARQNSASLDDLPAGGYICKIVRPILNDDAASGKMNIELQVDISEGEYAGYFKKLEDKYGFWGLRGWMSFKESEIAKFQQTCVALCNSNPGFKFDPFHGSVDVDDLEGKLIGAVIGKEEYKSSQGDIREKNVVSRFIEVEKIRAKKYKIPPLRKLKPQFETPEDEFIPFPS